MYYFRSVYTDKERFSNFGHCNTESFTSLIGRNSTGQIQKGKTASDNNLSGSQDRTRAISATRTKSAKLCHICHHGVFDKEKYAKCPVCNKKFHNT